MTESPHPPERRLGWQRGRPRSTHRLRTAAGPLTLLPIVWFLAFFPLSAVGALSDPGSATPLVLGLVLVVGTLATALLSFATFVLLLVDVVGNPGLADVQRVMWILLLLGVAPLAMPMYWWLVMRRPAASSGTAATSPCAQEVPAGPLWQP